MKLYYIFPRGFRDRVGKRAMTSDEVIEFANSIELTQKDIALKEFRPDIFDMVKLKTTLESLDSASLCLWGNDQWSVARDKQLERQTT